MCNFNQVFRGKQRYHYSCCRRRMHQIVAAPCCSSGHNRVATEESIEMCWPRTCPEINGTAKIPLVENTSTGEQLPRKSPTSTSKIPDPLKTNPLPKEISRTAGQKKSNNKLSDNCVSSTSKKLSKGSPVQSNLSHKVSVNNSVKMARLSGGSIEIKKNKKSCICTSCEVDSLMSVCSSEADYGSPMSMSSPKTSRKCKKMKPCKSRLEPQDTDLKALVRTKPKRKKILQRRWPTRSPECPRLDGVNTQQTNIRFDESNSQQTNDDDGVWFECNLPFRVNIPIPISFRNLFSLKSFPNNASQGRAIVPARNYGNCLTMNNALPAPVPEPRPQPQPQPVTTMRGRRRLKTRPSPSPNPSPNLSSGPNPSASPNPNHNPSPCPYPWPYPGPYPGPCPRSCSYPCETSTQTGVEESDLLRCLYDIKNQLAAKATECHCFAEKSTYVRTLEDQNKAREGAKRRDEKPSKISIDSAAPSDSQSEVRTPTTKTKRTVKKPKQTQSGSLTSVSRNTSKSSLSEVSKPPTKTKKTKRKPMKTQSSLSTSVSRYSSKSSLNEAPKPPTKSKIPKESVSISSKTSCSCFCSFSEVPEPPINTSKSGGKPKKPTSNTPTTSVSKNRSTTSFHSQKKLEEKEEKIQHDSNSIKSKKPGETVGSIKDIDMEKMHVSSGPEPEVENKHIEPKIEENKYRQIQKEREWIDPTPPIAMAAPRTFPNECGMRQGLEYQTHCMYHGYNAGPPPMYQTPQYPGHCYQQTWPNCQRNAYLWDNTPQIPCFYQDPCSATATPVESRPSRPLVEVLNCEQIEPVRKPSVGFCPCLPTEPIEPVRKPSGSLCTCLPTETRVGTMPCKPLAEVLKCEPIEPVRKTSGSFCACLPTSTTVESLPCRPVRKPSVGFCPCLPTEPIEPVRKASGGFCAWLSTSTTVESLPCRPPVEVMKCEQIEPVRKPSVGFCNRPQVISEYSYPTTQGSQCQDCSQRCGQNWTIAISSSTEYNRKGLLKRALCRNASPIDSLRGPGVRCNRKSSAKSICFRVCPSQPQICNENRNTSSRAPEKKCESNERSMASSYRTNHQHLPSDRINTSGETIGTKGSQCSSVSRETKSVSFSILEFSDQEYYFPLTDMSQRSNNTANMSSSQVDHSKRDRSLNDEIVIKVSVLQSNASRGSGKKKEVCSLRKPTSQPKVNDNMSYNQHTSRDGIFEDKIIVNFTNRSFSINSEEFERSTSEEQQRSIDEDLASGYSENMCSRDQSVSESIRTNEEDDIDEAPSTSRKNVQKFESRLIYSKLNRQSSTERSDQYQESESLTYNSFNSGEWYSKHRPMPCTRHLSGMCKQSSSTEKQAKKQQKSPKININIPVLINKKKRSSSAPGCSCASEPRNGKSRSETPVINRQNLSPRNQDPEKLTQGSDNVQDAGSDTELEHAKHIPSERIQKNDNRNDKNICKIPDYSLKASMMQAKQRSEGRCFIPSQQLGRTHQNESNATELDHEKHIPSERIRKKDNRKDKNLFKIPDYSVKASMMQAKQRGECRCFIPSQQLGRTHQNESNDTELDHEKYIPSERIRKKDNRKDKNLFKIPDYSLKAKHRGECRCFIPSQQKERTQNVPRYMPDYQNKQHESPRNVETQNADYQHSRQNPIKNRNTIIDCQPDEWTDPTSAELQTESDESYQVPEIRGQPKRPPFQERSPSPCRQNKRTPHMRSPHNKDIPKTRLRKPSSEEEYFHGYIPRACKCQTKTFHRKMNSTSDIYPESRNNSRYIHEKNTQIISSESEPIKGNSDFESAEISLLASKEESDDSRSGVCKPNNTYSKFVQSGRATDTETLKTLLQPRRLRCNESTTVWNPDMGTGNTVLLEMRTICKKDNLLQTCARPPCYCPGHNARIPPANVPVQSPNLHPENVSSLRASYQIDPRDRWSTMKSPVAAQAPSCQMQIDPHHPGYQPQVVKEAIQNLPIGFYDQTIQHYNVIRMDSDFQVPPFGSEVIQAVQAFPQSHCGCPVCPYGNPMQQPMMRPVQDINRPFFLPRNHFQYRLPMGPTPFCPRPSKY